MARNKSKSKKNSALPVRRNLTSETARFFLEKFREARAAALRDGENFHEVIYVLERLGLFLHGAIGLGLNDYKDDFVRVARNSVLFRETSEQLNPWIPRFRTLSYRPLRSQ